MSQPRTPNCSNCIVPASLIGKRARGVVEIGGQDPTSGVSPRRKRASAKPRQAAPKPTASHVQAYSIQGAYKGHTRGIQGAYKGHTRGIQGAYKGYTGGKG